MVDHSTHISTEFTDVEPVEPPEISLILEQMPFPQDSGEVKTMEEIAAENGWQFVMAVGNTVITSDIEKIYEAYYAQCGKSSDGSVVATIYVFKTPANLIYNLTTNYGEFIGDPVTESIVKEESVIFRLERSVNLNYVIESIESIEWEGDVYDNSGKVIYPSVPTLSGTSLVTNQEVYGVCRIAYKVFGDTRQLKILPRENTDENKFQSTVFAFYGENQVETLEINSPTFTDLCDQSVQVCINDDCEQPADGEGGEDSTSTTLQLVAYDYCTGAAVSGAKFYIGGKQVPATGHTVKTGVTYSIKVTASGYKDSDTDDLSGNDSFSV